MIFGHSCLYKAFALLGMSLVVVGCLLTLSVMAYSFKVWVKNKAYERLTRFDGGF